eukprot:2502740-Prymnesium_polylepis.1
MTTEEVTVSKSSTTNGFTKTNTVVLSRQSYHSERKRDAGQPHPSTSHVRSPVPRAVSYTHLTLPTICSV